ncbi:MAG: SH3 domain-containing protein [Anaerolineales bacterium]|nr:SH3 domain-containing protein [Anaerolineales bacterium]
MSSSASDTGPTPPPGASIPMGALIGIVVVALVGLGLLAYALLSLFGGAPPASATAVAVASVAPATAAPLPTTALVIPTVTSAPAEPPTAAPTEAPAVTAAPAATAAPAGPAVNITLPANVRAGPGINYAIIGGLDVGSTPAVTGRDASTTWYVIAYLGGQGWVSNQVAQFAGDINALPVVAAPPLPPTAVPSPVPTNAPPPATATTAAGSARGVRGDHFALQTTARTFGLNQDIWFEFKITNTSGNTISYRCLGAKVPGGPAKCSWGSTATDVLKPGDVIEWNDHMNIGTAGTYTLVLGICYLSDTSACENSGTAGWEYLSSGIQITVQ